MFQVGWQVHFITGTYDNMILILLEQNLSEFSLEPWLLNFSLGNICVYELSRVQLFVTPWAVTCQATLSVEFSRQEYWNGLPFPSSGDIPSPGIEPASPALAGGFFTTAPLGKPILGTFSSVCCCLFVLHSFIHVFLEQSRCTRHWETRKLAPWLLHSPLI